MKTKRLLVSIPLDTTTMIADTAAVEKLLKPFGAVNDGSGAGFGMRDIDFTLPAKNYEAAKAAFLAAYSNGRVY